MKIIFELKAMKIVQGLLELISSTIVNFEYMSRDLEHEIGKDILTKKIGESAKDRTCKYSLRDRYGAICDRLLNSSLTIAKSVGVEEKEFRKAIDEVVGASRIYDGEYDSYFALSPYEECFELDRGSKRWWKPKSRD